MRRVRLDCKKCVYHTYEGISERCALQDNQYENWLGLVYKEHPSQKNYDGKCKDYKEKEDGS